MTTGLARTPRHGIHDLFRARSEKNLRRRENWGLLFVMPVVLYFATFYIYPVLSGLYLSFAHFSILHPPDWTGFRNYQGLLSDPSFWQAVRVTLVFVVGSTVPVWVFSLLAAILFSQKFPGRGTLKAVFFLPVLPSLVVVAVIWKVLLVPAGLVTSVLKPFLGRGEINWLSDLSLVPFSMILVNWWTAIPFYMLIWLAGLTAIPNDLREAARIDGSSNFQAFWHIDLPLLGNTSVLVVAVTTINACQGFVLQYILGPGYGGPAGASTTLGLLIWKYGFQYYQMGSAAAASVVLFVVILILTMLQLRFSRGDTSSWNG